MSDQSREPELSGWAAGGLAFAAMMLGLVGSFQVIAGLVGVFNDEFFVVSRNYTFDLDATAWGVIHLLIGIAMLFTSYGLFTQAPWAGVVTMVICAISAIENFFFIPYYPLWSIVIIAIDVWIIWAITRPGGMRTT